jgi:hypothetical protein
MLLRRELGALDVSRGKDLARENFDASHRIFVPAVDGLIRTARTALTTGT